MKKKRTQEWERISFLWAVQERATQMDKALEQFSQMLFNLPQAHSTQQQA